MKLIAELNDSTFDDALENARLPMLADFYAAWCGPCKMLAPALEKLSGEFAGRIQFAKVNVDLAPELALRFEITGVPTLILFINGRILDTLVGMPSPQALKARLERLAGAAASAPRPAA